MEQETGNAQDDPYLSDTKFVDTESNRKLKGPKLTEKRTGHYPKFKNAILLVTLFVGLQLGLGFVLGIVYGFFKVDIPGFSVPIVLVMSFLLFMHIVSKREDITFRSIFKYRKTPFTLFPIVAITCCGLNIILSEVDNLIRTILPMNLFWRNVFQFLIPDRMITAIILLVVIAPVTEEIIFRRIILDGFIKNYIAILAIIATSFLFGISHLNPWQFVTSFFIGLYFSWIYLETRSLQTCIFAHAFFNFFTVFTIKIAKVNIPGYTSPSTNGFQPLWFDLLGVVLLVVGLLISYLLLKQTTSTHIHEDNKIE